MKDIFKATSTLGVVPLNKKKFNDFQLFKEEKPENVKLIKIKIWWGTPCQNEISLTIKPPTLLGIQCTYKNIQTEKEITSEPHCGKLLSNDIIVKEINLQGKDYLNKFNIGFDYSDIYLIGFKTKKGVDMKFGNGISKKIDVNNGDNLIQGFYGYYNDYGINALGCKYINKKDYILLHLKEFFKLRHLIQVGDKEIMKKIKKDNLNKLKLSSKAFGMLCLLPESLFFHIIKYVI